MIKFKLSALTEWKTSLAIAIPCLVLAIGVHLFFGAYLPQGLISAGIHGLYILLWVLFIVAILFMILNDIDAWPRAVVMLLSLTLIIMAGASANSYKNDKAANINYDKVKLK